MLINIGAILVLFLCNAEATIRQIKSTMVDETQKMNRLSRMPTVSAAVKEAEEAERLAVLRRQEENCKAHEERNSVKNLLVGAKSTKVSFSHMPTLKREVLTLPKHPKHKYISSINSRSKDWFESHESVHELTLFDVKERLGETTEISHDFFIKNNYGCLLPQPLDQEELSSCVVNAIVMLLTFDKNVQANRYLYEDGLSRLYLYWHARFLEGNEDKDSGVSIASSFQALYEYGVSSETAWPYDVSQFAVEPSIEAKNDAKNKAHLYDHLKIVKIEQDISVLKYTLSKLHRPFVFAIKIYDSFSKRSCGKVPMPSENDIYEGDHAVLAIGYSDDMESFEVLNSYGSSWGNNGKFLLPYSYILDRELA